MTEKIDVSIIIVSYNVCDLLIACINSLRTHISSCNYEIIVVDNSSEDNTVEMLQSLFPVDVILIANSDNVGFSIANNQGAAISKGDYLLFLNPDTIFTEDAVKSAFDFANNNRDAGIMSYRLLNYDGSNQMTTYIFPSLISEFFHFFQVKKMLKIRFFMFLIELVKPFLGKQVNSYMSSNVIELEPREVDVIPGAFMFCRRKAVLDIGIFDEDFFLYSEDIDLCRRVRNSNWKIYILPTTPVIHYEGQSLITKFRNISVTRYKGTFLYYSKHHTKVFMVALRMIAISSFIFRVFYYCIFSKLLFSVKGRHFIFDEIKSYYQVIRVSFIL